MMSNEDQPASVRPSASSELDLARLHLLLQEPLNAEMPLAQQIGGITANSAFYVRTHLLNVPQLSAADWRLQVEGEVEQTLALTYEELRSLPSRSMLVTLECAGNGRAYMGGQPQGEPWHYGAVGTAEWTGAPLRTVLERARLRPAAREIIIEGADHGYHPESQRVLSYTRSLPVDVALHPDTLLAYAMNGDPLPVLHGFPVRLIVPGWYGMASVKWVIRLSASAERLLGFFQTERYILDAPGRGAERVPLTRMRPRSLILSPAAGARLPPGEHLLRGLAWSGAAPIKRVEISADEGQTWEQAEFTSAALPYAWRSWQYLWRKMASGAVTLQSRAVDEQGNTQPAAPEWNRLGYANNAIQRVPVVIL